MQQVRLSRTQMGPFITYTDPKAKWRASNSKNCTSLLTFEFCASTSVSQEVNKILVMNMWLLDNSIKEQDPWTKRHVTQQIFLHQNCSNKSCVQFIFSRVLFPFYFALDTTQQTYLFLITTNIYSWYSTYPPPIPLDMFFFYVKSSSCSFKEKLFSVEYFSCKSVIICHFCKMNYFSGSLLSS